MGHESATVASIVLPVDTRVKLTRCPQCEPPAYVAEGSATMYALSGLTAPQCPATPFCVSGHRWVGGQITSSGEESEIGQDLQ